jgi:hypothetical protein
MKLNSRRVIAAVALSGLISGAAIHQTQARDDSSTTNKSGVAAPGKAARKMPKVQDCSGQNECKGIGGCKTEAHACKFKNDCKGKGGCSITKEDIKKWEKMQKEKKA